MNSPTYTDRTPARRPPIANDPAPANNFDRGVTIASEAAVNRERTPGDRRKE